MNAYIVQIPLHAIHDKQRKIGRKLYINKDKICASNGSKSEKNVHKQNAIIKRHKYSEYKKHKNSG